MSLQFKTPHHPKSRFVPPVYTPHTITESSRTNDILNTQPTPQPIYKQIKHIFNVPNNLNRATKINKIDPSTLIHQTPITDKSSGNNPSATSSSIANDISKPPQSAIQPSKLQFNNYKRNNDNPNDTNARAHKRHTTYYNTIDQFSSNDNNDMEVEESPIRPIRYSHKKIRNTNNDTQPSKLQQSNTSILYGSDTDTDNNNNNTSELDEQLTAELSYNFKHMSARKQRRLPLPIKQYEFKTSKTEQQNKKFDLDKQLRESQIKLQRMNMMNHNKEHERLKHIEQMKHDIERIQSEQLQRQQKVYQQQAELRQREQVAAAEKQRQHEILLQQQQQHREAEQQQPTLNHSRRVTRSSMRSSSRKKSHTNSIDHTNDINNINTNQPLTNTTNQQYTTKDNKRVSLRSRLHDRTVQLHQHESDQLYQTQQRTQLLPCIELAVHQRALNKSPVELLYEFCPSVIKDQSCTTNKQLYKLLKKGLISFHPDRARHLSDIKQQLESECIFQLLHNTYLKVGESIQ